MKRVQVAAAVKPRTVSVPAARQAEPAVIRLIGRVMCTKKILRKFGLMSDVIFT